MELLKSRILTDGKVKDEQIIKVDGFLNHQIDIELMHEISREFKRLFQQEKITKVITIEASGIAVACFTALQFHVPVVFAKKSAALNQGKNLAQESIYSFTHQTECVIRADRGYVPSGSRVLVVDDFLADGEAVRGMISLVEQCDSQVVGVGIAIEKGFQPGGKALRQQGVDLMSLAVIREIRDGRILFGDR